ncbi:reverse transcriptase domain-containing protein [Tanacetum coccineum]|uniref:Reverse transcriptase domain-containing protein n=1 Tax=Tanacetum coccineum TaxID=301880 RepID=A0ABQ5ISZ1_9ASTR
MADNRTMAELLQAPTEGYEDAIVVPEIEAANFEIKHGLLTLVQNKQFFGHDKEDPHAHIPRIWLEKEPPRSIQTWDDLVAKFINQFFPPSKTTNLRNEITNFKQRFDESFSEAWDRFKDLLRSMWQLFGQRPADCSSFIESNVADLKDMVRALLLGQADISSSSSRSCKSGLSKVVLPAVVPTHIVIVQLPIATITEITSKNFVSKLSRQQILTKDILVTASATDGEPNQTTRFSSHATQQPSKQSESLEPKPKPWEWLQPGSNPTTREHSILLLVSCSREF